MEERRGYVPVLWVIYGLRPQELCAIATQLELAGNLFAELDDRLPRHLR